MMEGGFNRTAVLRLPGTRSFRSGNPFIDVLADAVSIDDRGQASVFWRRSQDMRGEPQVYFGLDYLVEADIKAALALIGEDPEALQAVRRQADHMFGPFMSRVWMPAGRDSAVELPELVKWLDLPYAPNKGDINLNPARIGPLLDLFGGISTFADSAHTAEAAGRHELTRVSELITRCGDAHQRGLRAIAIQRAQAQARHAAGQLLRDTESYLTDVEVAEALVNGLLQPRVDLVSVTCLVRGPLLAAERVN
jgi:ATP-dependent helicase HepA